MNTGNSNTDKVLAMKKENPHGETPELGESGTVTNYFCCCCGEHTGMKNPGQHVKEFFSPKHKVTPCWNAECGKAGAR